MPNNCDEQEVRDSFEPSHNVLKRKRVILAMKIRPDYTAERGTMSNSGVIVPA